MDPEACKIILQIDADHLVVLVDGGILVKLKALHLHVVDRSLDVVCTDGEMAVCAGAGSLVELDGGTCEDAGVSDL